jgi:hypothetical protein
MLCKVPARSRPASQLLANKELPNGLVAPNRLLRCGMEPALNLDSKAALLADAPAEAWSREGGVFAPYGLAEGVARLDFGSKDAVELLKEVTGGNRDGTVPARVRRVELGFVVDAEPVVTCPESKSGKLSLPGDSGIVSRSGVEWPLPVVGGPHSCGDRPS